MTDEPTTQGPELTIAFTPVQLALIVFGLFVLIALRRRCRAN